MALANVLAQQAEEAALLWLRRNAAVDQPHFALPDLAKLDSRLEAHLDGLRIAGAEGWAAAEYELLRWKEPGEVFTAAVLAFEGGDESHVQRVLALAITSEERSRPVVSALGWLSFDQAVKYIDTFSAADSPLLRRIGIAASAVHHRDPGQPLMEALEDDDASLRARAIKAVAELGRTDLLPFAKSSLVAADDRVRFTAAWSAAILAADGGAVEVLRTIVENRRTGSGPALPVVLSRMDVAQAVAWIRQLQVDAKLARPAVNAARLLGSPDLVDELLEQMKDQRLARLAGEAFSAITGAKLAVDGLEGKRPSDFESGPTEDPTDDNVDMDPDENLPWPDQDKIAAWWTEHAADFTPGRRYLLGKPVAEDWLQHALRHGYQRQRAAAAMELAIRRPGTPLFEVRAPGFRQQELLR